MICNFIKGKRKLKREMNLRVCAKTCGQPKYLEVIHA